MKKYVVKDTFPEYCEVSDILAAKAMQQMELMQMLMDGKPHEVKTASGETIEATLNKPMTYEQLFLFAYILGVKDGQNGSMP